MPAPRTHERWFVSTLSDPGAKLRVLAAKPIGANRLVKEFDTPEEAEAAVREHNDRLNEKGPASAATDPDHGSTIPAEETAMNRPNDATRPIDPAMPDLSTVFCNVADLLDLADVLMRENLTRVSTTKDVGYTMRHEEANQLSSLLLVTSEYASRVRRQLDDANIEAIKRFEREAGRAA